MTNEELTQILFPPKEDKNNPEYCAPDYAKIVIELKKPHVTRNLLWKEYSIEAIGTGLKIYSISRFNELQRLHREQQDLHHKVQSSRRGTGA